MTHEKKKLDKVFQELYEGEITNYEAIALMDSDEAKDTLITLFNKGQIEPGYFGIKDWEWNKVEQRLSPKIN